MADPAMAAAGAAAERTNEPLGGLDPERRPVALRHLIRNGSGSVGCRMGTPPARFIGDHPPLSAERAGRIARWVELYAIRPVGIPAAGDPVELWETRIIRDFRAWGAERRAEREAGR